MTLLTGPVALPPPAGVSVVPFVSADELHTALLERFAACDALVMAAAPGDFRPETRAEGKVRRSGGPITLRLVPTEDILAAVARRRRPAQTVVAFAVEPGRDEAVSAAARAKLQAKRADYIVVNSPAAMAAGTSRACILSASRTVLDWADRPKTELARAIVRLLSQRP